MSPQCDPLLRKSTFPKHSLLGGVRDQMSILVVSVISHVTKWFLFGGIRDRPRDQMSIFGGVRDRPRDQMSIFGGVRDRPRDQMSIFGGVRDQSRDQILDKNVHLSEKCVHLSEKCVHLNEILKLCVANF
jgi:hypothetical protein